VAVPTSAIRPIQAAIRALVVADSTFTTRCPGGFVDDEEEDQTYPFLLMGPATHEKRWNTFGGRTVGNGNDAMIRLHVYSRYEGDREALLILERVVELLDHAALAVSGYGTVICEYQSSRTLVEDRDKLETRHIPVDFRVRVHE
jgi:hypothetical protein